MYRSNTLYALNLYYTLNSFNINVLSDLLYNIICIILNLSCWPTKSNIFTILFLNKRFPTPTLTNAQENLGLKNAREEYKGVKLGPLRCRIQYEIWGKTVRISDKAALPKSTATGLQQTWSIYSFPGQMETIKSEARQPSLYQFFTLSTHKLQKWQTPCFLQGKTHAMNFYQPNSHPYAWLTHRAMFFMLQPPVQLHELYRSEATGHCRSLARQKITT